MMERQANKFLFYKKNEKIQIILTNKGGQFGIILFIIHQNL
jgi:hypothetical protein